MGGLLKDAIRSGEVIPVPLQDVVYLMGHSIVLGMFLVLVTYFIATKWSDGLDGVSMKGTIDPNAPLDPKKKKLQTLQNILGHSNILFICTGLTGIMLLVNNNLVRAFAIVAALGLVRFRVKLNQKEMSATILFSILVGLACGVNELSIAWVSIGIYTILLFLVHMVIYFAK